jgi:hypothetical protein
MEWPVALRSDRRRQRMIVGLRIVADHFDLFFDEPFAGRRHKAGRIAEIVFAILVLVVPAGIYNHHIARPHKLACRFFQVIIGDRFPLLLRQRNNDAGAEKMRQRDFIDERRALNYVSGSIDMGRIVHRGGDALRQHT